MTLKLNYENMVRARISHKFVKDTVKIFYRTARISFDKEVSVFVIGDPEMKKLNWKYRKKNSTTDVLSFSPRDGKISLPKTLQDFGEIFISYPRALRQAKEAGQGIRREVQTLLVHGLAHLLGHDHKTRREAKMMEKIEKRVLKKL